MAGINDYTLQVILKAHEEGMAAMTAAVTGGLAAIVAETELANASLKRLSDQGAEHSRLLRNITDDTYKTADAAARMADSLESKLTPALNNTNKAASGATGGGGSGLLGFVNAILPGGQTAAAMAIGIAALAVAFAPFTAELAASLVLLGAWVVGATAFIGVMALAAGGVALLAAGIAFLGIQQMGGLNPAAALASAQTKLTSATNQAAAAQETVNVALLRYQTHPTAMNALLLKQAQEQLTESQQKQGDAQNAVNTATTNANGPMATLRTSIQNMATTLGQQAVPATSQMLVWVTSLVPKLQDLGSSLITWFGDRLPAVLKVASDAADNLFKGLDRIGKGWGQVVDYALARSPEFGGILNGAFNRVIDGVLGLMINLERLTDWFVARLPTLGKNANDTLANLGIVVQFIGKELGLFVDWIILHWPEINRVFNAAWEAFKQGWKDIQPFLGDFQTYMKELLPLIKWISEHLGTLKIIMEGMGAVVLILVAALFALYTIGVLVVAGLIGLGLVLQGLVERGVGVFTIVNMMAKEAWPALSAAGQELWKALDTLLGTFGSLFDSHEKTVKSSGHVVTAVHDTRDSFTQFMTSSGVIGILAFLSVQLPADILVAASWLLVLADKVALTMTLIGTTIKVTADIARGDWAQAGKDMVIGNDAANALLKKGTKDWADATILTSQMMNGAVEAQTESFKQAMISKFTEMNTGTSTQVGNMKDQHLHHIQELNDRIVGKSIVPDMVNSVISWFGTMGSSTTTAVNTMVGAIARSFGTLSGSLNSTLTDAIRIIDLFIQAVDKLPGVNIPQIHMAQGGVVNPNAGPPGLRPLAQGGTLPGYAPGQDSVLAMLSPGEGVLTPQAVRGLGGAAVIDTINKVAPHFAAGGVVGNPYPAGQCTWGVYSMFPGMPVDGNAKDWMGLPLAKAGGPAPGEIVVYGTSYSPFGHVARVDSGLNAAGQFGVTEMNYKGVGIWDQRMSSMAGVLGFLRPGVPGAPGGASGAPIGGIDIFGPIVDAASGIAKSALNAIPQWIRGLPDAVVDQLANGVKAMASNFTGAGTPSGSAVNLGGNVSSWVSQGLALAGKPASWLGAMLQLVSKESGGNANAFNPITVLGQHATGLLQMLMSTFLAHAVPGHMNILNAVDNSASSANYIAGRYGSPNNIPGLFGGAYSGYDSGGSLQPGLTLAYNGTGRAETVTPAASMDRVEGLLAAVVAELKDMNGKPRLSGMTATQRVG